MQFPNLEWELDFAFNHTADAPMLKALTITDELTKTALAIEVERSISGDDLVRLLDRLTSVHGHPVFIRMDNGPEMTCHTVADWSRFSAIGSVFIEPGAPWQTAFMESFNGKLRNELLTIVLLHTQLKAKIMVEDYRTRYNTYRHHTCLGCRTPNDLRLDRSKNHHPKLSKTLTH